MNITPPLLALLASCLILSTAHQQQPQQDACSLRSDDVPCLHVSACGVEPAAAFGNFRVCDPASDAPAVQRTVGTMCYDADGIHVSEIASEAHIFSPYVTCNSEVFDSSDVLEVFIAPVLSVLDNPEFYFELDAAPTGAMWGGLSDNPRGNASTCVSETGCGEGSIGTLPCSGISTFAHNMTVAVANRTRAWETHLYIPWGIFDPQFQPPSGGGGGGGGSSSSSSNTTAPWPFWRLNFYRYDYPDGPNDDFSNYELTGWSPTHEANFHVPERFGVAVFV